MGYIKIWLVIGRDGEKNTSSCFYIRGIKAKIKKYFFYFIFIFFLHVHRNNLHNSHFLVCVILRFCCM